MMATTHALVGLLVAGIAAVVAPVSAPLAVGAGLLGGVFPDFDLYAGHRRTLHYPVVFPVLAAAGTVAAVLLPGPVTVALAVFLWAAALHCTMDRFGGGLELRPWLGESDRAVYDHVRGRWLAPRTGVRYDGAPEDLALATVVALPSLYVFEFGTQVRTAVLALLLVSLGYTVVRRRIVEFGQALFARLPDRVVGRLPDRLVEDVT